METKLTTEILQSYLAFGLEWQVTNDDGLETIDKMESLTSFDGGIVSFKDSPDLYLDGEDEDNNNVYKPLLHPLSSLTKTITHEGKEIVPIVELAKIAFENDFYGFRLNTSDGIVLKIIPSNKKEKIESIFSFNAKTVDFDCCMYNGHQIQVNNQLQLFQWLYRHHFDLHGLIENGLAIAKDSLNTQTNGK